MNDEALGQLLRDADSASAPPQIAGDLPVRVRRRLHRRQMSVRLAGVGLLVLISMLFMARHGSRPPASVANRDQPPKAVPVELLKVEAAQLASEAAVHEQIADALLSARRRSLRQQEWQRIAAAPDPLQKIDEARDLAAAILVRDAARLPEHAEQATALYRNAAELFPDTRAGKRAAGMLKQGASGI